MYVCLTMFNKIAIQGKKIQMASGQGNSWLIESPTILHLCVKCLSEIFVNFIFEHIHIYTICR